MLRCWAASAGESHFAGKRGHSWQTQVTQPSATSHGMACAHQPREVRCGKEIPAPADDARRHARNDKAPPHFVYLAACWPAGARNTEKGQDRLLANFAALRRADATHVFTDHKAMFSSVLSSWWGTAQRMQSSHWAATLSPPQSQCLYV